MTALAANLDLQTRDGLEIDVPVMAAEIIYEGAPVFVHDSDGYAYSPDGSTNTLTVGDLFVGFCSEKCDNSAGAAGDKRVKVQIKGLVHLPVSGTLTQAKLGDPVFVNGTSDDSTLTLTSDLTELEAIVGIFVIHDTSTHGFIDVSKHSLTRVGWGLAGPSATAEGYKNAKLVKFTYDFSVDGGAQGTIAIGHLPSGTIVLGTKIDILTTLTSGGSATIALDLNAGNDIKTATAVATWTAGDMQAAATAEFGASTIKLTAARSLLVNIATADLTAGKFDVFMLVANV